METGLDFDERAHPAFCFGIFRLMMKRVEAQGQFGKDERRIKGINPEKYLMVILLICGRGGRIM